MNNLMRTSQLLSLTLLLAGCASNGSDYNDLEKEIAKRPAASASVDTEQSTAERAKGLDNPFYRFDQQQMSLSPKTASKSQDDKVRFSCVHIAKGIDTRHINDLSLSFYEMDLRDALVELSVMTNVPIIIDESVMGLVTANMSGINLDEALEILLSGGDFSYRKMKNHILVGSALPDSPIYHKLAKSCQYRPLYAKPVDLATALPPYYQQYINLHPGADYLSVTAPPGVLNRIKHSLRNFDRAPHQVLLELSVVEVSTEAMELLGVDWNRYGRDPNTKMLRRLGAGEWDGIKPDYEQESFSIFTFGHVPMRTLADSLNVLRINGDAQIKAMPSIITLDGREANFSSTQTIWVPYLERGAGAKRKELTYGINMKIEPRISAQGQVRLEIHNASVSDLTFTDKERPKVISHAISNSVNIDDGDFLVLGGLLQKKVKRTSAGIPEVKDAPLIGYMFGQKEQKLTETEVLILIRPTILSAG